MGRPPSPEGVCFFGTYENEEQAAQSAGHILCRGDVSYKCTRRVVGNEQALHWRGIRNTNTRVPYHRANRAWPSLIGSPFMTRSENPYPSCLLSVLLFPPLICIYLELLFRVCLLAAVSAPESESRVSCRGPLQINEFGIKGCWRAKP